MASTNEYLAGIIVLYLLSAERFHKGNIHMKVEAHKIAVIYT
jgi:hypothetical protein